MTLLHRSPVAEVHVGDARDVLAAMETESVHLAVVDPPYGWEYVSHRRAEPLPMLVGDTPADRDAAAAIIREAVRLVGQSRHLYVFGPADVLDGQLIAGAVELVWDKGSPGSGDLNAQWSTSHEPLTFAVSKHRHAGETGADPLPARMRKGSVLRYHRPTGRTLRHPTEKPVALLAELVESSTRQGEVVLDPCCGAGGVGVAAILRGRRAVLVDVDERYARVAVDRVIQAERVAAEAGRL